MREQRTMLSRASAGALFTLSKVVLTVAKGRPVCAPRLQCVRGVSKDANDVMLPESASDCVTRLQAGNANTAISEGGGAQSQAVDQFAIDIWNTVLIEVICTQFKKNYSLSIFSLLSTCWCKSSAISLHFKLRVLFKFYTSD